MVFKLEIINLEIAPRGRIRCVSEITAHPYNPVKPYVIKTTNLAGLEPDYTVQKKLFYLQGFT